MDDAHPATPHVPHDGLHTPPAVLAPLLPLSDAVSEDVSTNSQLTQPQTPEPVLGNEDFEKMVDAGEQFQQEGLDHGRYSHLAERIDSHGWLALAEAAFEDEKKTEPALTSQMTDDNWLLGADQVLCNMHPTVLKTICSRDGNLTRLYHSNRDVNATLSRYNERSKEQASCYIQPLTLGANYAPLTLNQAEDVADHAHRYALRRGDHANDAYMIDKQFDIQNTWTKDRSVNSERWYLQTSKALIDPSRERQLLTFARVLGKTIAQCKARNETTIPIMHYVSYANPDDKRQKQHGALDGSANWLSKFVQALLTAMQLEPRVDTYTICLISEEGEAPIAEMLLSRLSRAYYFAGGFNIVQAGGSMNMIQLNDAEREEAWVKSSSWIEANTTYSETQDKELQRRKTLSDREFAEMIADKKKRVQELDTGMLEVLKRTKAAREIVDIEFCKKEFPKFLEKLEKTEKCAQDKLAGLR